MEGKFQGMSHPSRIRISILILLSATVMGCPLKAQESADYSYWVSTPDILSKEYTDAQGERRKAARSDLDLEKFMLERGYFWVNGRWAKKEKSIQSARNLAELKDSDGDGFDDFTEVKFHTDPFKSDSTPAAYFRANGSNRVVFYGTNPTAKTK